jgi:SPP1 family predicted phage head-tail adaptor
MTISARFMNHAIVIERATGGTRDERGAPTQTWATSSTVAASVQPLSDRDLVQLGQGGPVASTYKVYVPSGTDVTQADRLKEGSRLLQIDGIRDQAGAGHHLRLDVHEVEIV